MRLGPTPADIPDLDGIVAEVLDQRLSRTSRRPIAVALSGGGDSVALTLTAQAWAKAAGRSLLILTVDHGLQAESALWTEACRARAKALGANFRALRWAGEKPKAGLPAAARAARHRLLADAARGAGARVILIGHTADDLLEARAMRSVGSTTPEPRAWAPSPAWPEGRGVFLARPLLGVRRAAIRTWLEAQGESWIEDPANDDPRYARARARRELPEDAAPPAPRPPTPDALASLSEMDAAGVLAVPRDALRLTPRAEAKAFLSAACVCAAGAERPPLGVRVEGLLFRLLRDGAAVATLAGARIEADEETVRFMREAGEAARGGLKPLRLGTGQTAVWDGRFEVTADQVLEVRALRGLAARLRPEERAAIRGFPAHARPALPVTVEAERVQLVQARPLALERLRAACGLIDRESD